MNKRARVDPACIFGVSLVLSVVLWYPTMRATLDGNADITDAGVRYFLDLALSWAGVAGISAIVAMYAGHARRPTPPPEEDPARWRDETPQVARGEQGSNAA